jgi:predicted mannosyl-3-phosphoglycerate phosphatase (HAD superfamily)
MSENSQLLERLQKLLKWKKSKGYMASQLGVEVADVDELLKELRGVSREMDVEAETANYIADLEEDIVRLASERVNEDGSREISYRSSKPLTKEEIERLLHNQRL